MVPRLKEFDQVEKRRFSEKAADHRRVVDVEGVCLGDGPFLHPAGAAVVSVPVLSKGRALKWSITPQSPGY